MHQQEAPSLWATIDALGSAMPLTPGHVEATLRCRLQLERADEHARHWACSSTPMRLADGSAVTRVDLLLSPKDQFDATSRASFEISGPCISLEALRVRYGKLDLIQAPRGHSLNETAVYASRQPWGQLSFAFQQTQPDCLLRIGLSPNP